MGFKIGSFFSEKIPYLVTWGHLRIDEQLHACDASIAVKNDVGIIVEHHEWGVEYPTGRCNVMRKGTHPWLVHSKKLVDSSSLVSELAVSIICWVHR